MHRFLYGCDWPKSQTGPKVLVIHISKSIAPRVTIFDQSMDGDDSKVDLEGQGHRSKVKVTKSKNIILGLV